MSQRLLRSWRLVGLYVALLSVLLSSCLAYGVNTLSALKAQTLSVSSLTAANKLAAQLMDVANGDISALTAKDFVVIADSYGNLVSKTREIGGDKSNFDRLIKQADSLRNRCRDKIRSLESATNEDEAQLERLYRSDIWHDINYSLSAFSYWQAWAMLGIAHSKAGERDQVSWLNKAESGFQASSVRILYPGVVYGSWLGMGYVAAARGDEALAEQRFQRLVQALVSDPENPVRKIADSELTVLAIRRGEIQPIEAVKDGPLTPSIANVYLEEAFALLEQHRDSGAGAIGAGARLKRLIADGYLNSGLVARIMSFRDEIVGQDLGIFSLYVDTEFAYAYQQYDTAVLKYRDFQRQGGLKMLINLRTLQYHYAVALLKIEQFHDAYAVVETLRNESDLPGGVINALPKLSFLIAQALYEQKNSDKNRARVLRAGDYFLTKTPKDPNVGSVHLALGQLSFNPDRAKYHLSEAKKDSRLKGSISLSQLKRAVTEFNTAAESGSVAKQQGKAEAVLRHLNELSRRVGKKLWVRAVRLQMRTVLNQDLAGVLSAIEAIHRKAEKDQKVQLDGNVKQVLLWTKLRALDKTDQAQLQSFITALVNKGKAGSSMDAATQKEIYRFLLEKERREAFAQLIPLADALYPALAGQTHDQRQLRLLQIRAATKVGRGVEAFDMAKAMVQAFPNSGDAWTAYAESAEAIADTFTAERAWAKISGAQPDGSPHWRTAMNHRIELLAQSGDRKQELCAVLVEAGRYRHLASEAEQLTLGQRDEQYGCGL
ncbi:MAG: hypothetical protein KUG71_09125 [Porticoccaceae bacterium]|nr:hypothetical protein [Porticoccaceae bacterium]